MNRFGPLVSLCNKIGFIYSCIILLQIKITLSKVSCAVWKGNGFDLSNFHIWIMMGKKTIYKKLSN